MKRVIISGGGTGGHIFPAIAIADELKRQFTDVDILFVGAEGKMEMQKVPQAGYQIVALPIVGIQRRLTMRNIIKNSLLPFLLLRSLWKARKIIKQFRPQVVVGVGGYASGPTLQVASMLGIPTLIQEQNSFAGKTNRLLAKKASKICVAYSNMERFFPKEKIRTTGNPVRKNAVYIEGKREQATVHFGLDSKLFTVLIIGGSLGARTLNETLLAGMDELSKNNIQILWQCGSLYYKELKEHVAQKKVKNIHLVEFITDMDLAYCVADAIVSRAGAMAISELSIVQKPTILVPSPNVADDHQRHNALALSEQKAALLVEDKNAHRDLIATIIRLMNDENLQQQLAQNIRPFARPEASQEIVANIVSLLG